MGPHGADPNAAREARRYDKPIPSREFILGVLSDLGHPAREREIAAELALSSEQDLEALHRRLRAMVRDGQLVRNRRGDFCLPEKVGVIVGTVQAHRDGFGFLIPDEGDEDLYLAPRQMANLMHGDRVSVRLKSTDNRGRKEGSLVDILERATTTLVGRYFNESGVGFVEPDNTRFQHDVIIPEGERNGAEHGQIVVVQLTGYPAPHTQPKGKIVKVLGEHRAAGMEVEIAIHSFGLPHEFPTEVIEHAESYGDSVPEKAKEGRKDLRDLDLVTIDGEDARDFDDAVYCEPNDKGWRLIVAIADVAHYVQIDEVEDSPLDQEAQKRGTSVYFPDWVIPMLPENLSNGLCSLNPHVDRLCMVADMQVNQQGKVENSRFYNGVLQSKKRLTYNQVGALLEEGDKDVHQELGPLVDRLYALHELYKAFRKSRDKRGAIDFDRPETRILFDENRKISEIRPVVRNVAHKIIEECMIAANVEAAKFLHRHEVPTLYRAHAQPGEDSIEELREFLGPLGLTLGGGNSPQPKDYKKLIDSIQERDDRFLIETVLLRSMSRAVYQPKAEGHFGLALEHYAHFTSPIRRYPDLLVHRGIKKILDKSGKVEFPYTEKQMEQLGTHTSMTERRADDATRDAEAWLKCDFMTDKVGEEFQARVTGVTSFGLFVEIPDLQIEGLVHVTSLENDYYQHDPAARRLVGERTGLEFRLSDPIRVRVMRVDPDERKIDFEPVDARADGQRHRGEKKGGGGPKSGGQKQKGKPKGGGKANKGAGKDKKKTSKGKRRK
ncbi:MAG: ribonuclease R [Gammaproteobacteria bacterium]|nr:ribonuclease R [Gammaproteobacteria bacterium]